MSLACAANSGSDSLLSVLYLELVLAARRLLGRKRYGMEPVDLVQAALCRLFETEGWESEPVSRLRAMAIAAMPVEPDAVDVDWRMGEGKPIRETGDDWVRTQDCGAVR